MSFELLQTWTDFSTNVTIRLPRCPGLGVFSMPIVEWSYHRKNCTSCGKAAAFLAEHGIAIENQVDARKEPLDDVYARQLLNQAHVLYVTRGKNVIRFDLKNRHPGDESILELVIGRSGTLRAPAIKIGPTLIVGFDQATYEQVLL